jgi:hypothetical protein
MIGINIIHKKKSFNPSDEEHKDFVIHHKHLLELKNV